jgi:alpha/beta superfamily hydrolase
MSLTVHTTPHFPEGTAHFLLPGPAGNLEVYTHQVSENHTQHTGIICHPHPQQGGTMHNKVVTTIARSFRESNIDSIRFNFRGIGYSEGHYSEGEGELQDLLTIINWVKSLRPNSLITLAGFSFGSFISASATRYYHPYQLVLIAPPVEHIYFQSMPSIIECPWLVVQGSQDTVVSPNAVYTWAKQQSVKGNYQVLPHADHFFHGQLLELRQLVTQGLRLVD